MTPAKNPEKARGKVPEKAPVEDRARSTSGKAAAGTARAAAAPFGRVALWILAAAVAGLAAAAAALGLAALIDFPNPSNLARMSMGSLLVLLAGGSLCPALRVSAPEWSRWVAGLLGPALVSAVHQAFMLYGTPHYLNGVNGDQLNRVAYLGRFASSPALADAFYRDVAPFYPAAWFWVGGRLAALTGIPAWEFYKPWSIVTMSFAAALAFVAWRAVVGPRMAIALALATAVIGLQIAAYEPYSWLFIAVLPVVAIVAQRIADRRIAAGLGVFLGIAAISYTLIAAVAVLIVTAAAAFAFFRTPRDGRGTRLRILTSWLGAGVLSAVIALFFWGPYLFARLTAKPHERSVATDYAPASAIEWPMPMFEYTGVGVLSAAGLAWLVWTLAGTRFGHYSSEAAAPAAPSAPARLPRSTEVASALALLAGIGYLWFWLSGLRALGASTLLPFRLTPVIGLAFACAGVFALRSAWRAASTWAADRPGRPLLPRQVAALAGVVLAAITVHGVQASSEEDIDFAATATASSGPPQAVVTAISDVTGGAAPQDIEVLSDDPTLFMFEPYWAFQAPAAAYASPNGRFEARNGEIEAWSKASTGRELAAAIKTSEFGAPDALVLTVQPAAPAVQSSGAQASAAQGSDTKGPGDAAGAAPSAAAQKPAMESWVYSEIHNTMPLEGNINKVPLAFDPAVFSDPALFRVEKAGSMVVIGVR
ncbi:arabinofuranosyltransferase [Dietzia sp.]|uniref:arabinofuranosyltransferase n=1 Tax=Dietzia sp. TaxID=1871616 RepID=UPI002FDAEECF